MASFFKKNKEKQKGQESIIGKIIYSFLLFMPLLAILSETLINIFNENAKQEIEINYKYESNEVNTLDDLQVNKIYQIDNLYAENFHNQTPTEAYLYIHIIYYESISFNYGAPFLDEKYFYETYDSREANEMNTLLQLNYEEVNLTCIYITNGNAYACIYELGQLNYVKNIIFYFENIDDIETFKQYYTPQDEMPHYTDYNMVESVTEKETTPTDAFYNSINKIEKSNLYNWTKNTGTYTVLKTTTEGLGITNTFTPLLLTYWLIISVIYFIYDIALMLIWIVHRKIHELQESI